MATACPHLPNAVCCPRETEDAARYLIEMAPVQQTPRRLPEEAKDGKTGTVARRSARSLASPTHATQSEAVGLSVPANKVNGGKPPVKKKSAEDIKLVAMAAGLVVGTGLCILS